MYAGMCICIQNWSRFLLQHAGPVPSKYQCAVCRFAICGEDSISSKFQLSSWHDFESEQTCGIQGLPWSNSQVSMCTFYFKFILEIIWTLLYWIVVWFVFFSVWGFCLIAWMDKCLCINLYIFLEFEKQSLHLMYV